MFTTDNTNGFSAADLAALNEALDRLAREFPDADPRNLADLLNNAWDEGATADALYAAAARQLGRGASYPVYDVTRADYTRDCEPVGEASSEAEAIAILKRVLGNEAPAAVELNDRDTRGGQLWAYWPL